MHAFLTWFILAIGLGLLFAWLIVQTFQKVVPPGTTRTYWMGVGGNIRGLIYGNEEKFWQYYRAVIRDSVAYVVRQLAAIVLAFAPLAVSLVLVGPWIYQQWDNGAELTAFPPEAGRISIPAALGDSTGDESPILTLANDYRLALSERPGSQVVCRPGRLACLVLAGFGFTVVSVEPSLSGLDQLVVVRTDHKSFNPVWPYLSDPEFLFFVSLVIGSTIFFMMSSRRQETQDGYTIGFTDYLLTQLAANGISTMNKLGNLETRRNKSQISTIEIHKPIFVCGLARSGTTILLEKLASLEGIATHRYRDFPFVMTPIWWNRFLSVFGSRQKPVERPHKDKIQITRNSPDAFEEPIWKHFFPFVHSPDSRHVLDGETDPGEFAEFYSDHIKKIMFIRSGSRYLSKGNYNLSRIEFISKMFPDARFVVPVRHPLAHVDSLVRQHELFVDYARADPSVSDYLESVGHYEFGPQRTPICVTVEEGQEIIQAWKSGNEQLGYALQWAQIYRFVLYLVANSGDLARRIRIVRFEDLCESPEEQLSKILRTCDLGNTGTAADLAVGIQPSAHVRDYSAEEYDQCWSVVQSVAQAFGYSRIPAESGEPIFPQDSITM